MSQPCGVLIQAIHMSAPQTAVEPSTSVRLDALDDGYQHGFSFVEFMRFAGPGLIMSTAFIDPGDLESDLQMGALFGFMLLWALLYCTILGYIMAMFSAKLGVGSGKDLATLCRENYAWPVRIVLWIIAEAALIGVEIQYIIGGAVGFSLLCGDALPLWASVIIVSVLAFLTLALDVYGFHMVKMAFLSLIGVMVLSFIVMAIKAQAPGLDVLRGLAVPQVPSEVPGSDYDSNTATLLLGGVVGGAISPYNYFLYSFLVIQRDSIPMKTRGEKRTALKYFSIEAAIALFFALFMNICVICSFSSAFFNTDMAQDAGLLNAGYMLGDVFGIAYKYIWALGLFATGLSSATGAVYAGQSIMSGFFDIKVSVWWRAAITRSVAIIPALVVAATRPRDQDELDWINIWLNLLQTITLPFALFPLMHFTTSKIIMGEFWANHWALAVMGWLITFFVTFVALWCTYWSTPLPATVGASVGAWIGVALYSLLALYIGIGPDNLRRCFEFLKVGLRAALPLPAKAGMPTATAHVSHIGPVTKTEQTAS